jgi:hypothetical protein
MAQFLIAHMNQGQVNGVQLLEPETVALMHGQHVLSSADVGMQASGLASVAKCRPPARPGRSAKVTGSQPSSTGSARSTM